MCCVSLPGPKNQKRHRQRTTHEWRLVNEEGASEETMCLPPFVCERVSEQQPLPSFSCRPASPLFSRACQTLRSRRIQQEDLLSLIYLLCLPFYCSVPGFVLFCKTLRALVVERGGVREADTKKATQNRNQFDLGRGSKARDGPHFLMAPGQTWRAVSSNISMPRQSTVGGRRAESSNSKLLSDHDVDEAIQLDCHF